MKALILFLVFFLANGYGQPIEWAAGTVLELSDFKNPGTDLNGNIVTLHPGVSIGFGYQMMTAQLMFTKNFNSKVSCTFNPQNALLVAPDESSAGRLLAYAQYCFDTAELYARKLRKLLYESKKTTSSPDFFRTHYETIEQAMTLRVTEAGKKPISVRIRLCYSNCMQKYSPKLKHTPTFANRANPNANNDQVLASGKF